MGHWWAQLDRSTRERVSTLGAFVAVVAVSLLLGVVLPSCQSLGLGGMSGATRAAGAERRAERFVPRMAVEGIGGEPDIRVRVLTAHEGVVNLAAPGSAGAGSGGGGLISVRGPAGTPEVSGSSVDVSLEEKGWLVTPAGGPAASFPRGAELIVRSGGAGKEPTAADGSVGRLRVSTAANPKGTEYPGELRLSARSDVSMRALDAIEFIGLERYLEGVVSGELFRNWPLETFQVQAICARTYAIQEKLRKSGARYDVESTTRDQVYTGVSELAVAAEAVRSTRGIVITHAGRVIRAYYSSTCGGRAASAMDTFPTGPGYEYNLTPPIQARAREHSCESSRLYRWTRTRDRKELEKRLAAWGKDNGHPVKALGALESVRAAQFNALSRPTRFVVSDAAGKTYTLSAEDFRVACNTSAPGLPAITGETRVASGDVEVVSQGNVFTISGRGFGHGVGMCQYCAKGFADKGEAWWTMVERFYPGAMVVRAY
ncbi:MAG: SpoIID/LytB domain-containing protein [Phycisphaerae bacterium]|nr:SpoIID/LytB domain-containing protein [Phycisphaerae bacterium]